MTPDTLNIALKEWATVVDALASGRQIILLRKGGILEQSPGREFAMSHGRFLLFPTYVHQKRGELKPEIEFDSASEEPRALQLRSFCSVQRVIALTRRDEMNALDAEHIWTDALIDLRFAYKPDRPLFLVIVRTYLLPQPVSIENRPQYAGCKSWVPLGEAVDISGAEPAVGEKAFSARCDSIARAIA